MPTLSRGAAGKPAKRALIGLLQDPASGAEETARITLAWKVGP